MPIDTTTITQRTGTAAEWAASSLVLGKGERGLATDTNEVKVGDGVNTWNNLTSEGREGRATLVAGTKVVNDASVTAKSIILLTIQSLGTVTAPKAIGVTARTPGTSFTITSADATDTSVIGYQIIEGP